MTAGELARLSGHNLADNTSLMRVRDVFLFSVYTGLRYSDVMQLQAHHLKKDKTGSQWLEIAQQKTGDTLYVPLLDQAVALIDRFSNSPDRPAHYLVPRISNQKLNVYLKTIAELASIPKTLTHHVARHTFATTITLSNNMPIEVVSKLLGHRDLKTTMLYAKITQPYLAQRVAELNQTLKHG